MLGLNETAVLHRLLGRKGGRNVYETPGTPFPCRIEPTLSRKASGDSEEGSARLRVFAEPAANFAPRPGDRVELPAGSFRVAEVGYLADLRGLHHLEIELREAGRGHER